LPARNFIFAEGMAALRIVFMGTAELSCASLEALARGPQFQVVAAVTQPDRSRGRELRLQPSPVKTLAQKLSFPVLQPARARDEKFITDLRALRPDLVVVAAYGQILPQSILDLPPYGCLNVHTSLLPKYRGAAPIQWAIAKGETETGVTIMKMDAGLDTGPIVSQRRTAIRPEDDSAILHDRLAQLGAELLAQTIPDYVAGKIQPEPQPAEGVSLAPKIKKEDGRIDWNLPAKEILNRLRAFTPWPGTYTGWSSSFSLSRAQDTLKRELQPRLLKIWRVEMVKNSGNPGTVLSADKNGIVVACGRDGLRILELQPEGGRRMSAAEFLAGHPMRTGETFV
jgi:methionyl-tRNA formyltransferase